MSLTGALNTAVSGIQTAQRQMQVTSGNVTNANVEGFSRKTASPETIVVGSQNAGVRLGEVTREVDEFLTKQVRRQETSLANLEAQSQIMTRVQELFGTLRNDSTLANTLTRLQDSLEQLQTDPESQATRNGVVQAARETAQEFNRFNREALELRGQVDSDINLAVSDLNETLKEVRDLNDRISSAKATGNPVGELQDERDRALTTVSQMMDVRTFERSTGEIVVMNPQGQPLVDSQASQLNFDITGAFNAGTDGKPVTFQNGDVVTSSVGGRLGALLQLRDETLPNFMQDVDRLAATTRDTVNAAHNLGSGNPPAQELTGSRIIGDVNDTVELTSDVRFAVVNEDSGEITDTVTIPAGTHTVTDLATMLDGLADASATAAVDEGLSITADDGFRIAVVDTGDQTVTGQGGLVDEEANSFSGFFGLNDLFQTPGVPLNDTVDGENGASQMMQVRSDILRDPKLISAGQLVGENPGDRAVPSGDNRVAQRLADAFEQTVEFGATNNLDSRETTLAGFGGDLLQFHASEAARVERNAQFQSAVRDELKFRADSQSGVNLDEELSNLLLFEQAHNASARVITTVQRMFDTLEAMMR